ncbi:unnamed protein product [Prorocentrum cordatum]|nr:unnamed protein product [Polarella glacialis]
MSMNPMDFVSDFMTSDFVSERMGCMAFVYVSSRLSVLEVCVNDLYARAGTLACEQMGRPVTKASPSQRRRSRARQVKHRLWLCSTSSSCQVGDFTGLCRADVVALRYSRNRGPAGTAPWTGVRASSTPGVGPSSPMYVSPAATAGVTTISHHFQNVLESDIAVVEDARVASVDPVPDAVPDVSVSDASASVQLAATGVTTTSHHFPKMSASGVAVEVEDARVTFVEPVPDGVPDALVSDASASVNLATMGATMHSPSSPNVYENGAAVEAEGARVSGADPTPDAVPAVPASDASCSVHPPALAIGPRAVRIKRSCFRREVPVAETPPVLASTADHVVHSLLPRPYVDSGVLRTYLGMFPKEGDDESSDEESVNAQRIWVVDFLGAWHQCPHEERDAFVQAWAEPLVYGHFPDMCHCLRCISTEERIDIAHRRKASVLVQALLDIVGPVWHSAL